MIDVSQTWPVRPALVRLALALTIAIAMVLSLVVTTASHADGVNGVSAIEVSCDLSGELGAVGSTHCHCPQATTASTVQRSPLLMVAFTAYVGADDRALATVVLPPQLEPPRA